MNWWPASIKGGQWSPPTSKAMVHTRSSARSKPVARLTSNPRDQYSLSMAATINLANLGMDVALLDG